MEKNNIEFKDVISRCGCDKILPLAIVYIFYIILHGHLSPGGGFQGGILTVAVVCLLIIGHGYETAAKALSPSLAHPLEGAALVIYCVIAFLGVVFLGSFCANVWYNIGNIGELFSSGSIFFMNSAVAMDVVTASIVLGMGMTSILIAQDEND